ncbi:hypothetical protein ALP75_204947 [Pseudomonas syringae pv. actinidiae]|nr:hypothetical protein ALP75_204947 [Pseudomonas syringae pv. actinidiae]
MPIDTKTMFTAVAIKMRLCVEAKKITNAVLTTTAVVNAAGRRCIMQKMQTITVIPMKNATCA